MPQTDRKTVRRVMMSRKVASAWITKVATPEFRFRVLSGHKDLRRMVSLLRSFRDAKVKIAGLSPLPDLGVREDGGSLTVWSSRREAIVTLKDWFEKRGYETTGVW